MVYKLRTFERFGFKQVVKTTESSVPLHNEEIILKLLHHKDILPYKKTHKFIHIGRIQIAFRPLTLYNRTKSSHTFISHLDYIVDTHQTSRASTSQIREEFDSPSSVEDSVENLIINNNNIVHKMTNKNFQQVKETDTVSEMNFSI